MIELHGWLNRNSLRSFPIREDSVLVAENTGWTIPSSLVVDLFVVAPGASNLCITAVTVTSKIVSVVIGDRDTGESVATASAVIGEGTPYARKDLIAIMPGAAGSIVFGPLVAEGDNGWKSEDQGQHIFGAKTMIESRCVLNPGPFPITSFSPRRGSAPIAGFVSLLTNDQVVVGVSEGEDGGDPLSLVSFDLADPAAFVSPCETRESPCQCRFLPIMSINDVLPDDNGRIFLELVDEHGHIVPLGAHGLSFLLTRTSADICVKPVMPDEYGRLPDALGEYTSDKPPITVYKNPSDVTFPDAPENP